MKDDLEDLFAQETVWVVEERPSFTTDERSVIATALAQLSKTVPSSGCDFANLLKGFVDDLETSWTANAEIEREVER